MNENNPLPLLVTFDGEARSGKGTIVQAAKDYLRDDCGYKVMLIDAGQVFRVLVVAATKVGVDVNDASAIDEFLGDDDQAEKSVRLVKDVYHMEKEERDQLLYTNEVGANSAKIGARPLSQYFKDNLLKKWLRDAHDEGYEVILLDGRSLEEVGAMLEREKLCRFVLGFYFICDEIVGARRTLGYADRDYDDLETEEKQAVDALVEQIQQRNKSDAEREVQPTRRPDGESHYLPKIEVDTNQSTRPILLVDTSASMTKEQMTAPVAEAVCRTITS